ncbi:tRNA pseudouridine(38-40) synthase TruA, partial [bacterium]|nr:tRNA pseudouridine(38-40) synthase TruA [bacterium]
MVSGNRTDGIRIRIDDKNRIVLVLQYDGTRFNGWQIQKNGRTVQGELERALEILVKEEVRVIASGRTDAGVHALGQVVHFDVKKRIDLQRVCVGLNGILDWDISIGNAYSVSHDFHARFSAIEREYLYLIYNHKQRCSFMNHRAMWECATLDIGYLRDVARNLIGERDFSCFCKKISSSGNTVRRIIDIK